MRKISMTQQDMADIDLLYNIVLEDARVGLLYREGRIHARHLIEGAGPEYILTTAVERLISQGWATGARLEENGAVIEGSFEGSVTSGQPRCHRMRGILCHVYEESRMEMCDVTETTCVSRGDDVCTFVIEALEL